MREPWQPTGSPGLALAPNGSLNAQDQSFIQQQASDNAAEIQAGQLAETQGGSQAVGVYGRWLVLDHTVLNAALTPIAEAGGIALTDTPDDQQTATNATLQGLTEPRRVCRRLSLLRRLTAASAPACPVTWQKSCVRWSARTVS